VDFSFWQSEAEEGDAEASLTEATISQGGKDARRCVWIRWNMVLVVAV